MPDRTYTPGELRDAISALLGAADQGVRRFASERGTYLGLHPSVTAIELTGSGQFDEVKVYLEGEDQNTEVDIPLAYAVGDAAGMSELHEAYLREQEERRRQAAARVAEARAAGQVRARGTLERILSEYPELIDQLSVILLNGTLPPES
jgi:hypothetical protein